MANIKNSKKEIIKMLLAQDIINESEDELLDLLLENSVILDVDKEMEKVSTWKDRLADKITSIAGSWKFIILFAWITKRSLFNWFKRLKHSLRI